MAEDLMRYDVLTQDALRGVVKGALRIVAKSGLPGDHHFFIAFNTNAKGVRMSERLRQRYPGEMTVVLQHQFWNLVVREDEFEVELMFNEIPERLVIPYQAIKGFLDPSVQFGLQFEAMNADLAAVADTKAVATETLPEPADAPKVEDTEPAEPAEPKVVSLDAFRKK
jgi:hypothetical protein